MIGEKERFWNFCFVHWDYKKFWSVYWCKEVIFWDSRTMELLDMEVGAFSLPCKFTNCEDDLFGVFRHLLGCSGSWKEIFIFTFILFYIFIYLFILKELGLIRGFCTEPCYFWGILIWSYSPMNAIIVCLQLWEASMDL